LFERGDIVRIVYCPEFPELKNVDARVEWSAGKNFLDDLVYPTSFEPTAWQKNYAWYTVTLVDGNEFRFLRAFITHKVSIGATVTVNNGGTSWKEIAGKRFTVRNLMPDGSIVINHMIPVRVYDYTPVKKVNSMSYVAPANDGIDREELVRQLAAVAEGKQNAYAAMKALGVSVKDDLDYTKKYSVTFGVSLDVTFPKGTDTGDTSTILMAVAEQLAGKSATEIAEILESWYSDIWAPSK
jgi:hypothetical protein